MSQGESFIDEVSDEIRRDRLFAFFRRWAWLAILVILLAVGLAAWNEWRKARAQTEARALGDAIVAALSEGDPSSRAAALGLIEADGATRAVLDMLAAAETAGSEASDIATVALGAEASRENAAARWRDLATLKLVLLEAPALAPEERIARLEPLTAGSPYRLLALEQIAWARVELGETDVAIATLRDILADGDLTGDLRRRATQMIVALGGDVAPA